MAALTYEPGSQKPGSLLSGDNGLCFKVLYSKVSDTNFSPQAEDLLLTGDFYIRL